MADSADTTTGIDDKRSDAVEHAEKIEEIILDVRTMLNAIFAGGLLDAAPAAPDSARDHATGVHLAYMAEVRLREIDNIPGADLSSKVAALARAC